jgi:hypothetical protein
MSHVVSITESRGDQNHSHLAASSALGSRKRLLNDSFIYILSGQVERAVGFLLTFAMRWGLSPADIGIYSGLRLFLDNTSYSSLGVALGAVQKRPILRASGNLAEADRITCVAAGTNLITSAIYAIFLLIWGIVLAFSGNPKWGVGLILIGLMVVMKRNQDFQIAVMRSDSEFQSSSKIAILVNMAFSILMLIGIYFAGYWGILTGLILGFVIQGELLKKMNQWRFHCIFDFKTALNLAVAGMPILAVNSSWFLIGSLDRILILGSMPNGSLNAGYYSLAILATSWCQDIAGRAAIVLYPEYQKSIGLGVGSSSVLAKAELNSLLMIGLLVAIAICVVPVGYLILPLLFPRLTPGIAAFIPILPGAVFLAGSWPLRQSWIAIGRPWVAAFIAMLVAIPQYFMMKSACLNRSIGDIAAMSSLFQVVAMVLLLFMTGISINTSKAICFRRFVSMTFIILSGIGFREVAIQTQSLSIANINMGNILQFFRSIIWIQISVIFMGVLMVRLMKSPICNEKVAE